MMWLVQLALRRPLTVAAMALLMLVLGLLSFFQMNIDIFPAIRLPVVMVVWNYPGLSAIQMERRMVWISERAYSTTVNGIEHIESQSIDGLGILRVYLHAGSDLGSAIVQINAVSETILTILPRGTQPPQIISYDASNLPVAQLNMFSDQLSEQQLFDYGLNFVRIQLFTIPGFSTPAPLGGVQRAVMVNIDPLRLYALGLSPQDVGQALSSENVVIPSGTAKMGNYQYDIDLNMSPETVAAFNSLPIKVVGNTPVLLRDVAPVSDTHQPQTNVVRVDGRRGSYLMVIKHADASTLSVVKAVRNRLPRLLGSLPKNLEIITAPFDGMVTARYFDPGALIPQTTASSGNMPLVAVATLSPIRVYCDVPQDVAPFIRDSDAAAISVSEYPGRTFQGKIMRHPEALTEATRTMLVEVDLPNRHQDLYPGMYAKVSLRILAPMKAQMVPDDALVFREGKPYVPVVRNNTLRLVPVTLGFDDGVNVEVSGPISGQDMVALNVGQAARDGERVQPIASQAQTPGMQSPH